MQTHCAKFQSICIGVPKYGNEYLQKIKDKKEPMQKLNEGNKNFEEIKQFSQDVQLLIHVVNENEVWAVLDHMDGPKLSSGNLPKPINLELNQIILGMFSKYKAALVHTKMGSSCEDELLHAFQILPNIKAIIALGIAWGRCYQPHELEMADVLVATRILSLDGNEKIQDGHTIYRNRCYYDIHNQFVRIFAWGKGTWSDFCCTDGRQSVAHPGVIISLPKLVNDIKFRDQLVEENDREAKGGEMESYVLVKLVHDKKLKPDIKVAVIKGVSDFADGHKHDEWQLTAAMAAVNYAKHKLDKDEGLF